MQIFIRKFKDLYDGYMLALMLFIGLFLLFRDVPLLKKKNLIRDMKIAKALGYIYITGGIVLFVVAKLYKG